MYCMYICVRVCVRMCDLSEKKKKKMEAYGRLKGCTCSSFPVWLCVRVRLRLLVAALAFLLAANGRNKDSKRRWGIGEGMRDNRESIVAVEGPMICRAKVPEVDAGERGKGWGGVGFVRNQGVPTVREMICRGGMSYAYRIICAVSMIWF